jgi:flagellar biosynthesis protein FlhB
VTDPAAFFESSQWVPIVAGIVIALGVHATKMFVRPAANALTAGAAAPVLSTGEDIGALAFSLFAILIPIFVIIALIALFVLVFAIFRKMRRQRQSVAPA